jgi:hypothetical protein
MPIWIPAMRCGAEIIRLGRCVPVAVAMLAHQLHHHLVWTPAEAGTPRLMFVLDEDAAVPIPPGRLLDRDPVLQERRRAFRTRC